MSDSLVVTFWDFRDMEHEAGRNPSTWENQEWKDRYYAIRNSLLSALSKCEGMERVGIVKLELVPSLYRALKELRSAACDVTFDIDAGKDHPLDIAIKRVNKLIFEIERKAK